MDLGREAAAAVSKTFIAPVKLEFEKVRCADTLSLKQSVVILPFVRSFTRAFSLSLSHTHTRTHTRTLPSPL
jgi:hypothetical protein